VAKTFSFLHHFVNNTDNNQPQDLYYGSEIFQKESFLPGDPHPPLSEIGKSTIYYHKDASSEELYTKQHDDHNCGVYALWYMLTKIYAPKDLCEGNPHRFRQQLILYIVGLNIYIDSMKFKEDLREYPDVPTVLFQHQAATSQINFRELFLKEIKVEPFMPTPKFHNLAKYVQQAIYDENRSFVTMELKQLLDKM